MSEDAEERLVTANPTHTWWYNMSPLTNLQTNKTLFGVVHYALCGEETIHNRC